MVCWQTKTSCGRDKIVPLHPMASPKSLVSSPRWLLVPPKRLWGVSVFVSSRKPLASMTHPKDKAFVALNVSAMLSKGHLGLVELGVRETRSSTWWAHNPDIVNKNWRKQEFPIYGLICIKHQQSQTHNSTISEMNMISSLLEIAFHFDHTNLFQESFNRLFLLLHQIFSLSFKALFVLPAL